MKFIHNFLVHQIYNMNLKDQYLSGISANKLSKIYGVSVTTITNRLKKLNVKLNNYSTNADWSFIDTNNNLFFYFLGWSISDGCIHHVFRNGRNRGVKYILTTHKKDILILNFFKKLIKNDVKLASNKNCKQFISSIPRSYATKLSNWGLIQRKTKEFKMTNKLNSINKNQFYQFLVGFIEGDGNTTPLKINNKLYKRIRIHNGSIVLIKFIRQRLYKYGFGIRKIEFDNRSNSMTYNITGKNADKLSKKLLNCEFKLLKRKWNNLN